MSDSPDDIDRNTQEQLFSIYLSEYEQLKAEQGQRIGFRDNLLYVTLGLFGAVFSYAVSDPKHAYALLVLPWVSFIMGWTYIMNDEKISTLGTYIRQQLEPQIKQLIQISNRDLFGWEYGHLNTKWRNQRKIFQLFVNLLTFCLSGLAALAVFWFKAAPLSLLMQSLIVTGCILLLILAIWLVLYAGFSE